MLRTNSGHESTEQRLPCGSRLASFQATSSAVERRSGSVAVLLVIAAAVAVVFGAWYWLSQPDAQRDESSAERTAVTEQEESPLSEADLAGGTVAAGPRALGKVDAGPAGDYSRMERDFDGRGLIRGEVSIVQGVPYPESWTLTLEPSRVAEGRDRAVTRTLTSEPGQRDFELLDLPLAAYRIHVEADGLASRSQEVVIFKIAGTNSGITEPYVDIRLRPVAWVDGSIRTADGGIADDMPVYLVDREDPAGRRYAARTNTAGTFRFDRVERGAWLLQVGDPVRPLVASIPVVVGLEPVRLDEVVLPELATLELIVLDEYARPFPDVDLVGYLRSTGSGSFRVRSDSVGRATIRYLTPGPWRVEAKYELEGQSGKADLALIASESETLHEIHIR